MNIPEIKRERFFFLPLPQLGPIAGLLSFPLPPLPRMPFPLRPAEPRVARPAAPHPGPHRRTTQPQPIPAPQGIPALLSTLCR